MQTLHPDCEQVQDLLPESVQQIASLIGFPATSKLIRQFGGVQFRIGKGLRSSGQRRIALLQETLTPEQVALLMQHFSGEDLYIPRCQDAWRAWRNRCFLAEIEQLKAEGESLTMALTLLCPKHGIAATRAWELLRVPGKHRLRVSCPPCSEHHPLRPRNGLTTATFPKITLIQ